MVSQLLPVQSYKILILVINIVCTAFIALLSPVKHPNKELTEKQKKQNKLNAFLTSFILSIISGILIFAGFNKGVTISITLVAVAVLMVIGILTRIGGDKNV